MSRRALAATVGAMAFAIVFMAAAAPNAPAHAAHLPSPVDALRVASLAERIVKLHAQIAQGILAPRGRRALETALRELDRDVRALGMPPPPSELHERVAILAILAGQYRTWALRNPGRDVSAALAERAEEVEWEARRIAELVPAPAGSEEALAVKAVAAGADAEHIARLLLWERWRIAPAAAGDDVARAKGALQRSLDELAAAPQTDSATRAELQVAQNQASFLFAASWSGEGARASLEYAVKASDNARESLERLAALYEKMGR